MGGDRRERRAAGGAPETDARRMARRSPRRMLCRRTLRLHEPSVATCISRLAKKVWLTAPDFQRDRADKRGGDRHPGSRRCGGRGASRRMSLRLPVASRRPPTRRSAARWSTSEPRKRLCLRQPDSGRRPAPRPETPEEAAEREQRYREISESVSQSAAADGDGELGDDALNGRRRQSHGGHRAVEPSGRGFRRASRTLPARAGSVPASAGSAGRLPRRW